MAVAAKTLHESAQELDALLVAFEHRFLYIVDLYNEPKSQTEIRERERACTAFYHIRDIIDALTNRPDMLETVVETAKADNDDLKVREPSEPLRISNQGKKGAASKAKTNKKNEKKDIEPDPVEVEDPEDVEETLTDEEIERRYIQRVHEKEADFYSCKHVVLTAKGNVRIINTVKGNFYAPADIAKMCGSRSSDTWVRRNIIENNKAGVNVFKATYLEAGKSGKLTNHQMYVTDKDGAEKIMAWFSCPQDLEEYIYRRIFGHLFNRMSIKLPMARLAPVSKSGKPDDEMNSFTYRNGEVQVTWK